jgi:hypothetical protein
MIKLVRAWIVGLAILTGGSKLAAETFQNSYISFELPPGWRCELEQVEWVCTDRAESPQSSAIIILTAKERGTIDRLDLYEDELSRPRPLRDTNGNPLGRSSRILFVRSEPISTRMWVHGRQFESEVPNYYTDYFATVDEQIAILVTFSAHTSVFDRAFAQFYPSMASIRPKTLQK